MVRQHFLIGTAALLLGTSAVSGQAGQQSSARPSFAGTWKPAEPAKSSVFFDNGIGWIPGDGRLVIEQSPTRLTITVHVPDAKLDPLLTIHGEFHQTVIYRITEPQGRSGGSGAAGDLRFSSWQDNRLVVKRSRTESRTFTVYLSLEGDRLRKETHTVVTIDPKDKKESTVTEWFERIK